MKNKIKIGNGILLVVITLFLLNSASAFAISAKYHEGNPLYILPGESKEVPFILQNLGSTSNLSVKLQVDSGKEFIKINDPSDIYLIPAGGRTEVNLTMSVPANAKMEEIFPVSLDFITLSASESGAFSLSSAIAQRFNAIIGTGIPPKKPAINFTLIGMIIAVVLAVGAVSYFAIKKKKR